MALMQLCCDAPTLVQITEADKGIAGQWPKWQIVHKSGYKQPYAEDM